MPCYQKWQQQYRLVAIIAWSPHHLKPRQSEVHTDIAPATRDLVLSHVPFRIWLRPQTVHIVGQSTFGQIAGATTHGGRDHGLNQSAHRCDRKRADEFRPIEKFKLAI